MPLPRLMSAAMNPIFTPPFDGESAAVFIPPQAVRPAAAIAPVKMITAAFIALLKFILTS